MEDDAADLHRHRAFAAGDEEPLSAGDDLRDRAVREVLGEHRPAEDGRDRLAVRGVRPGDREGALDVPALTDDVARLVEVLPDREDALRVDLDREAADAGRLRPVDGPVRHDVRRGGEGGRGKGERAEDDGDEESQVVLLSRGSCHTSNPCDAMTKPKLGAGAAGPERLVRRPVGAQPAAVPADAASRPVDEHAPARPGVAAAETGPAARGDLFEEASRGECVGERPDRQAGAVVAELGTALRLGQPRLGARAGEDRVQLGDRRLLVRGVPGPREAPSKAAQRLDVFLAGGALRVGQPMPGHEALHEADVAQALGVGLELVPRVEQTDREGGSVTGLELGVCHGASVELVRRSRALRR